MSYLDIKAQMAKRSELTTEWLAYHTYKYIYGRPTRVINVKLGRLPNYAPKTTKGNSSTRDKS